ncbi:Protein Iojap-related, mitochondrial [Capsicum annuum]|nr:Protein Iojap-related, mitochondrial [Capsicum annuum]
MWSVVRSRSFSCSAATQQWKLRFSMLNRSLSSSSSEGIREGELLQLDEVETILRDVKADNVKVIPIPKHCHFADFMVVATGRSAWHVRNIAQALIYKAGSSKWGGMFAEKEKTSKAEGRGITVLAILLHCTSHVSASDAMLEARTGLHCREKGKERMPLSNFLCFNLKGRKASDASSFFSNLCIFLVISNGYWNPGFDDCSQEKVPITVIFSFKNNYNSHLKVEQQSTKNEVKQKQKGSKRMLLPSVEGQEGGNWIVIDSGKLVIHAFDEKVRAYYNLEKLWSKDASNQDHDLVRRQILNILKLYRASPWQISLQLNSSIEVGFGLIGVYT